MFRIRHREGKHVPAYSHSNYIRKIDVDVWQLVKREAHKNGISVSRFVNYALWQYLVGEAPEETQLHPTSVTKKGRKKGEAPRA